MAQWKGGDSPSPFSDPTPVFIAAIQQSQHLQSFFAIVKNVYIFSI